jgi:hypothetical protein
MLLRPPVTRIPVAVAALSATVVTPPPVVGVVKVPPPEACADTIRLPLLVIEPRSGWALVNVAVPPTVVVVAALVRTMPCACA